MRVIGIVAGLALIVLMLTDAFETILQPRRVVHRFRYARLFYRGTWRIWRTAALSLRPGKKRQALLGMFGPLSLLGLFATWVIGLIIGFGLLQWSLQSSIHIFEGTPNFASYLYLSGSTFFTLGYGDVVAVGSLGRCAGRGRIWLGVRIPRGDHGVSPGAVSGVFATRADDLADGRPRRLTTQRFAVPSPAGAHGNISAAGTFLKEWEVWAGELLESHLSFPVLSYYRSQHDNQSWLAALATILDTSALLIIYGRNIVAYQAQLSFAMARHAAVDLSLILKVRPSAAAPTERFPPDQQQKLLEMLRQAGVEARQGAEFDAKFAELRGMYEPFLNGLAARFLLTIPPIILDSVADNWQRSAWMQHTPGIGSLPAMDDDHTGEHFT